MNLLVLSTLPHYYAVIPVYHKYPVYASIIVTSTTLSVVYHIYRETGIVVYLDYLMAFIWFLYDLKLAKEKLPEIITANILIFYVNVIIPYDDFYCVSHSIWHLLSALKAYYVSDLISA